MKHLETENSDVNSLAIVCSFLENIQSDQMLFYPGRDVWQVEHPEILYSIPGYCHDQLVRLVLRIYQPEMPEAFQILRCNSNTTEAELHLFLSRVLKVQSLYTVVGVDQLSFDLQEVCLCMKCVNGGLDYYHIISFRC